MQQLPLDLQVRTTSQHGDFIISDCNQIATRWVDRWLAQHQSGQPEQFRALNIAGPAASGKSHLAAVWQSASGAVILHGLDSGFDDHGNDKHFILDEVGSDSPAHGGFAEEGLFHLFNHVKQLDGSLMILSPSPVARMIWQLPDLSSRLRTVNLGQIEELDDQLLQALLQRHFAERQLVAPDNVVRYLVARMERSFAAARDIVARMDRASLANKSEISLSLARQVIDPKD